MSFIVEYKDGLLTKSEKIKNKTTPASIYMSDDKSFICNGELFDCSYDELNKIDWEKKPSKLNDIIGAKSVAKCYESYCNFAVDINGIDTFYYYHKSKHFILSDDFWDIVSIIKPEFKDLNKEYIRQSLFEGGSINGTTIIDNINILMPNTSGKYDAISDKLQISKISLFKYNPTCSDLNIAVDNMDKILTTTMKKIKEKCGNCKYGVGISGGLDSRIIAHYAKKQNMKLEGFNICIPKPHKLFYARSVNNASKIAKIFGIHYKNVPWKVSSINEKIIKCVKSSPDFNGNSFKYETENMPDFDVLLTGGSGIIVGSELPNNIDELSKNELIDCLYNQYSNPFRECFKDRVHRALSFLFGIKVHNKQDKLSYFGENLFGKNYKDKIYNDIINFVEERLKLNFKNIDIYEDWLINICGFRNRYGSFESLFGTKKSFSIYVPFLLKETLSWNTTFLYNRLVLNELIRQKVPEVSCIKSESFETAPNKKQTSLFSKIMSIGTFLIRGNGTAIDQYYMKKRYVCKQFLECLNANRNDWFHTLFNLQEIKFTYKVIKKEPSRILVRIWELKKLLDILENKSY